MSSKIPVQALSVNNYRLNIPGIPFDISEVLRGLIRSILDIFRASRGHATTRDDAEQAIPDGPTPCMLGSIAGIGSCQTFHLGSTAETNLMTWYRG